MRGAFHLAAFLARWHGAARHDLSASHSATLSLSALLALAKPEERARWEDLPLDYAEPYGAPALRALIAARHDGLEADDVICCAGAQEGMACVARALLAPGDHAVIVLPIYQPLEWAVTDRAYATGVRLEPGSFELDVDQVAAAMRPETRLVLANFPNSPTGAVLDPDTQTALIDLCRARGVWLVNDEVYRQTACHPAQQAPPVADVYERGVSIDALSKGFGLPGLRVGWVACRDRSLLAGIATAKATLSSCLAPPTELLAQIALREEPRLVGRARVTGAANRRSLDRLLRRHADSFEVDPSRSLAFAFPRYLGAEGTEAFAARLAAETGVLLLPGDLWRSPLGAAPDGRLRISLGQAGVRPGLEAIGAYLDFPEAARGCKPPASTSLLGQHRRDDVCWSTDQMAQSPWTPSLTAPWPPRFPLHRPAAPAPAQTGQRVTRRPVPGWNRPVTLQVELDGTLSSPACSEGF